MMSDVVISNVEFVDEIDTEDKGKIDPSQISQVVLSATDWTTETIISQFGRGNIDLKPRFQRRDAWTTRKKVDLSNLFYLVSLFHKLYLLREKVNEGVIWS
ncbi:MAG: hypothetical protein R3C14_52705 [Caldilineaceae bacterium]